MNILHVVSCLPKAAGTSVFCAEVCNGLVRAGHKVSIAVCNPAAQDCYPLDSRVKMISTDSLIDSKVRPNFDLVHIHALWEPVLQRVNKWAHRAELSVVWSPHGMLTPWALNNKRWKKRLAWWLYQKRGLAAAQLLHATAETEIEDIRRVGLNNKVIVAPLGVRINDRVDRVDRVDGKKVLLFVSRVQRKKGLINLARAWANLRLESSSWLNSWKVRIVGPDQEGHTQEVKAECERLGIIDDWEFVGPKYGDELQKEYAGADLFVLPTYSENFGSVVIEALAHKVPVITTKGTPWSELEAVKCGRWIDLSAEGSNPSAWPALVTALKEMMSISDEERRQMGVRGRQLVEEKYTWAAVVKAMVKGYESLVVSG